MSSWVIGLCLLNDSTSLSLSTIPIRTSDLSQEARLSSKGYVLFCVTKRFSCNDMTIYEPNLRGIHSQLVLSFSCSVNAAGLSFSYSD